MHTIEATYRIVTPMFLGDADQKATGIRPPSVKGALRFWWRALVWAEHRRRAGGDEARALCELHAREARLFGLAAKIENEHQAGGQGAFLLRVDPVGKLEGTLPPAEPGHQYLLGQGLYHFKDKYLRTALTDGQFTVRVLINPHRIKTGDVRSLLVAIRAFGLLGGLGSRSRKGLGSVALVDLRQEGEGGGLEADRDLLTIPGTLEQMQAAVRALVPMHPTDDEPPYSAFSKRARVVAVPSSEPAWKTLDAYGKELMRYRSWGQHGKVLGKEAERNFPDDHNLALEISKKTSVTKHPQRVVFGLPHNYFFSSTKGKAEMGPVHLVDGKWKPDGRGRRASPLLIHVHDFPGVGSAIVTTFLPARFLPEGERIEMATKGFSCRVEPVIDWNVLHRFLDRFENRQEWL